MKKKTVNTCIHCGKEVGNDVFTCCDGCWNKYPPYNEPKPESKVEKSCENCGFIFCKYNGHRKTELENFEKETYWDCWKPQKQLESVEVKTCIWKEDDDGYWQTGCQEAFCFIEGGVKENRMIYCPYCGNKIKIVKVKITGVK